MTCLNCPNTLPSKAKRFCSERCRKAYNQLAYHHRKRDREQQQQAEIQAEMFSKKSVDCNCNDYSHCIPCRNREKRMAHRQGRIPVYRLEIMKGL